MRRIVNRLHNAHLLASVAVIVVTIMTFVAVAIVGGSIRQHMQTVDMLDGLHFEVIQLGSIHSSIATTNAVSDVQVRELERIRVDVAADLNALEPRFDDPVVFEQLKSNYLAYIDSVETLMVAAQTGALSDGRGVATKAQTARALFEHAVSIGAAREYLSDESARAWNRARVGFAGAILFLAGSVLAITRLTERRLRRAHIDRERNRLDREHATQLAALMEHSSDAIIVLDETGRIHYSSQGIEQILGQPPADLVGTHMFSLMHPEDLANNEQIRMAFIERGPGAEPVTSTARARRADGGWTWIEAIATNRFDVPGIEGIVINVRDITERRRVEAQLRFHALHDALTGLANRTTFTSHVGNALRRARRSGTSFAVMFIDLDNFKHINDTWGHTIGDELLIGIADRLREVLRESDMAGRQGGDEFVLLIEDVANAGEAVAVAERIRLALSRPFIIDDLELTTAASIGVYILDQSQETNVADILRYADIAMYRAKRMGRNRTVVFNGLDAERADDLRATA